MQYAMVGASAKSAAPSCLVSFSLSRSTIFLVQQQSVKAPTLRSVYKYRSIRRKQKKSDSKTIMYPPLNKRIDIKK